MHENTIRFIAKAAVAVGLILLIRVIFLAANGALAARLFPESQHTWVNYLYALGLSLPVPLHVISVGLVLQRKWLPPHWTRIVWLAVFISGCWLGVVLVIKGFLIE